MKALLILGNQLFDPELLQKRIAESKKYIVYLREDMELCTYFRFHKHKIIFFLAAMRNYAEELRGLGYKVHYEELEKSKKKYEEHFIDFLEENKIKEVVTFDIEDKFFEKRLHDKLSKNKTSLHILTSPLFLTSRKDFASYLSQGKKPFMKTFYERQRVKFNILVDKEKKPAGGKWSFDTENRKALPKDVIPPQIKKIPRSAIVKRVSLLCDRYFTSHPGDSAEFWLPTDRAGARAWLDQFLQERFPLFGPYEDAIPKNSDFVFHSVLTPFLNTGLLTPEEVVRQTLIWSKKHQIPLQTTEGFVRQIIGWREFIRGIYQNYSEKQDNTNFWNHQRRLSDLWYTGNTGVAPLDRTLDKVIKYSYAHHIERLMVLGSLMLLLEVHPQDAHRWFMEMFIDSSDWVMGPNVYGMALFSDGGIFATKPYICGSNYYRKMGGYKSEEWCDGVDGLYWQFIEKHKDFFLKNPRLSMMARTVEKMDVQRKKKIFEQADFLRKKLTVSV